VKGTPRRRQKRPRAAGRPRAGTFLSARETIVDAASRCLVARGYGALSTRAVAAEAGVTQSLIHYYFGTKERLMLAVFQRMTDALIERQTGMYHERLTFAEKWAQACQFYERDLASGYVRLHTELRALGISNSTIGAEVAKVTNQWRIVVEAACREALEHFGITSVAPEEAAAYIVAFWVGMDIELLLGVPEPVGHHRQALATFERFLRWLEAERAAGRPPLLT
jgi:AcrR family transcriptional regulator